MANAQFITIGPFYSGGVLQTAPKLYHYAAGTSTLKNIWSDRGETVTLAQPFVGDANGFAFFADGLYKLVVKDDTDSSTIATWDNFLIQDFTTTTFSEGAAITSASTIAVGPEIWAHVTGSTNIDTITGTIPWVWLVFDGNLNLNYSANLITPGNTTMPTVAGDVVLLLNDGSGVWRVAGGQHSRIGRQDGRTNSVAQALTVQATTTGSPASGIGTGILLQAESADENPSDVGQVECAFSDVGTGTEDSYFQVLLRVAGAALTACYRWAATGAFKGIFTHANTADRTYTLPNRDTTVDAGDVYMGPSSCASGSTRSHEGTVTVSSNGNYSGIHFYTDFTLNSSTTMTVPAGKKRLIIIATGTITINGTITASGAGGAGGVRNSGDHGTDQPGGGSGYSGGGGGYGGSVLIHGCLVQLGGFNTGGTGDAGTQVAGSDCSIFINPLQAMGGGGGGSDAGVGPANGGAGGGSIVLIAPIIILSATATLNTSGSAGGGGAGFGTYAGGGGGAGNVYIITRSYTDSGATFTLTGGAGGNAAGGLNGGAGASGIKQINIYA